MQIAKDDQTQIRKYLVVGVLSTNVLVRQIPLVI